MSLSQTLEKRLAILVRIALYIWMLTLRKEDEFVLFLRKNNYLYGVKCAFLFFYVNIGDFYVV